eukprot:3239426-Rhodomonas_salina.2
MQHPPSLLPPCSTASDVRARHENGVSHKYGRRVATRSSDPSLLNTLSSTLQSCSGAFKISLLPATPSFPSNHHSSLPSSSAPLPPHETKQKARAQNHKSSGIRNVILMPPLSNAQCSTHHLLCFIIRLAFSERRREEEIVGLLSA